MYLKNQHAYLSQRQQITQSAVGEGRLPQEISVLLCASVGKFRIKERDKIEAA